MGKRALFLGRQSKAGQGPVNLCFQPKLGADPGFANEARRAPAVHRQRPREAAAQIPPKQSV